MGVASSASSAVPKRNLHGEVPVTIDEILAVVKTGDLLFFRGNSWTSWLQRLTLWSNYSHVGMVEWRVLPGHTHATACLWESVGHLDAHQCVLHGRCKSGVRLVRLADRIADYAAGTWDGETPICLIHLHARSAERRAEMEQLMQKFISDACGDSYSTHVLDMLRSQIPVVLGPAHMGHLAGYTCNQLVTATLVRMRAYSIHTPVEKISLNGLMDGSLLEEWHEYGMLDQTNYHFIVRRGPASFV